MTDLRTLMLRDRERHPATFARAEAVLARLQAAGTPRALHLARSLKSEMTTLDHGIVWLWMEDYGPAVEDECAWAERRTVQKMENAA